MRNWRGSLPIAIIAIAVAGGGCGPQTDPNETMAKQAVTDLLTDPASVQFRKIQVHPKKGPPRTVCGEVNSKNRLGGYVGFKRFAYVIQSGEAQIENGIEVSATNIAFAPEHVTARLSFNRFYDESCVSIDLPSVEESKARESAARAKLERVESGTR